MSVQSLTRSSFLRQLASEGPDAEVWNDLYQRYSGWVFRSLRRWGASESDAEDLTQETLVRVYQHIQRYQHAGPCSFRAWIRTVARTTWLMLLRHRSRRPVLVSFQQQSGDSRASDDFGQDLSDMYQQLSTEAEQLERRELLELAFERVRVRVNAATWQAFELMTLGGYAAEEATRILGVSRATVYLSNARVRTLLLEELSSLDWV